jgi:SAM-dependent methyltransferase
MEPRGMKIIDVSKYPFILKSAFSNHYNETSDVWTDDVEMRSMPSLVQGFLKMAKPIHILDIGCGVGKDVEYFAKLGHSILGLDVCSHRGWKEIQSVYDKSNFLCVDFLQADLSEQFNLIYNSGCFHHQHPSNYLKYLKKISSLLKVDSNFVMSTFKSSGKFINVDSKGRLHKYFDDVELEELLNKAGFVINNQIDIYRNKKNEYYRLTFAKIFNTNIFGGGNGLVVC